MRLIVMSDYSEEEVDENQPPPVAQPSTQPAASLRQSGIFGRQPREGRGRGRGGSEAGDAPQPRYARLSMLDISLQGLGVPAGGGGSEAFSESSRDAEEEDLFGDADERKTRKRKKQPATSAAELLASAAFGSSMPPPPSDSDSEEDEKASQTSSKRKQTAEKSAFPLRGERCPGCCLASRTLPIENFVNANASRMSQTALFKFCALLWKKDVCDPVAREGGTPIEWSWRDIAVHYNTHVLNPALARVSTIQSLAAMRMQLENQLVKIGDDGERSLDKNHA